MGPCSDSFSIIQLTPKSCTKLQLLLWYDWKFGHWYINFWRIVEIWQNLLWWLGSLLLKWLGARFTRFLYKLIGSSTQCSGWGLFSLSVCFCWFGPRGKRFSIMIFGTLGDCNTFWSHKGLRGHTVPLLFVQRPLSLCRMYGSWMSFIPVHIRYTTIAVALSDTILYTRHTLLYSTKGQTAHQVQLS